MGVEKASNSDRPWFSIVVPAHNEQEHLPACLAAIEVAKQRVCRLALGSNRRAAEVIVVANRCTDRTAEIAAAAGAIVVTDSSRSIAAVRNAGAAVASGEVLVTIDADSKMAANVLVEVERHLSTGRYIGGGCSFVPERTSGGIWVTVAVTRLVMAITRLGGAMYWCRLADFRAIGGFDPKLTMAEDIDFARRLRAHGRRVNRQFTNLRNAPVVTLCRKFDRFGDWHMLGLVRRTSAVRASLQGRDTAFVDQYFYDFNG